VARIQHPVNGRRPGAPGLAAAPAPCLTAIPVDERDERFLQRAFEVARRSVAHGNMPFGAILVDAASEVVLEGENTAITEHDPTGHAETNLMREAGRRFAPDYLAGCTMYTSAEPCAMCAGAAYWVGIKRVVRNPTPHLRADVVLNMGKEPIVLEGPALLDEARAVHEGYWDEAAGRTR
jgi:tRNA(Arg) A34 adenosine deaminase TadA